MLISAIMPTRSRPPLSQVALDCFLAQTYEPRELVIIDDEDDPSFPIAESFASTVRLAFGTCAFLA